MRFLGIIGYIGCGFTVLAGIAFTLLRRLFLYSFGASSLGDAFGALGIMGALMGVVYVIIAVLLFFPSRWLYKTGAKIRDYARSGSDRDLEEAFRTNRAFWKYLGIILIIQLALLPVSIVVSIFTAVGAAFM